MRHDNVNCDLTIQAVARRWFVNVLIHKLRKRYSRITQICWNGDLAICPIAARIWLTQMLYPVPSTQSLHA